LQIVTDKRHLARACSMVWKRKTKILLIKLRRVETVSSRVSERSSERACVYVGHHQEACCLYFLETHTETSSSSSSSLLLLPYNLFNRERDYLIKKCINKAWWKLWFISAVHKLIAMPWESRSMLFSPLVITCLSSARRLDDLRLVVCWINISSLNCGLRFFSARWRWWLWKHQLLMLTVIVHLNYISLQRSLQLRFTLLVSSHSDFE
jgi:hypothetical protein